MLAGYNLAEINRALKWAFEERYKVTGTFRVKLVGILFARPFNLLSKDFIVPNLNYYHHRSADFVDFFCAGYGAYWYPPTEDQQVVAKVDNTEWLYSDAIFNGLRKEIQDITRWKYSGSTDLILTNAIYSETDKKVQLDFSNSLWFQLEKAIEDQAIASVEAFFEQIFKFSEKELVDINPSWELSKELLQKKFMDTAFKYILSLLPEKFRKEPGKYSQFIHVDLSK